MPAFLKLFPSGFCLYRRADSLSTQSTDVYGVEPERGPSWSHVCFDPGLALNSGSPLHTYDSPPLSLFSSSKMQTTMKQNSRVIATAVPSTQQAHSGPTTVTVLSGTGYSLFKTKQNQKKLEYTPAAVVEFFLDLSVWNKMTPHNPGELA